MLESLSVSLSDSLSREEEGKKENKAKQHAGMNQVRRKSYFFVSLMIKKKVRTCRGENGEKKKG